MSLPVIFVGPTLGPDEAQALLPCALRPPAARGDLLRAVEEGAQAIGLIDGVFERVAAVWHKEILWALSRGVRVYGAASMGALRAAELAAFGMIPVGPIAEAFLRGELDDDDEVTVAHRGPEEGFAALSDAMVNLRSTLGAARAAGVLSAGAHDALVAAAKARFYGERSYGALLAAGAPGVGAEEIEALRRFLPAGKVDQKREDARAMLRRMRDDEASAAPAAPRDWAFAHTDAWEALRRAVLGPARRDG